MKPKISFILQAHNEGKIIAHCLQSLETVRAYFPAIEVVAGLDGCTDNTLEVVRSFPNVKIVEAKERIGKTETENRGLAAATGDLIWVIWADEMVVANKEQMEWLVKAFEDDPKLGGMVYPQVDRFNIEESIDQVKGLLMLGDAWVPRFIIEYKEKYYSKKGGSRLYVDRTKMEMPFMVDIFRRKAIQKVSSVDDDAEICMELLAKGYEILLGKEGECPYKTDSMSMRTESGKPSYEPQPRTFGQMVRQKARGQFGRFQLEPKYRLGLWYYPKMGLYSLTHLQEIKKRRLECTIGILLWFLVAFIALFPAAYYRLSKKQSRDIWLGSQTPRTVKTP